MAIPEMQHASDSKHCRRCGAAYVYDAIYLGHLGRYRCPSCGQQRPAPAVAAERIELDGTRGSRFELTTPAGSASVELPLPGLYNVYNALGAAALCLGLEVPLETIVAGCARCRAAFGRAERIAIGDVELQVLLIKNPAGANEILRTLVLEHEELDLLAILNDRTADGRDVSWVWDADFEMLAARVRRVTCAGTRAAELAVRLKYAGVPTERLHVIPGLAPALDAALAAVQDRSPVRTADVHGPARAAPGAGGAGARRPVLGARGGGPAVSVIWHDLECGAYAEDLPLWRALAAEYGDPVLDVGAGTGRVALDLARAGYRVTALDRDPELARARSAPRGKNSDGPMSSQRSYAVADARDFDLGRAVPAGHRADADDPAAGRRRRPRPRSCAARAGTCSRRRAGGRDRRGARAVRGRRTGCPRRCPTCASTTGSCTRASRSRCAPSAAGSCSSAGARRSRRRASEPSSRT